MCNTPLDFWTSKPLTVSGVTFTHSPSFNAETALFGTLLLVLFGRAPASRSSFRRASCNSPLAKRNDLSFPSHQPGNAPAASSRTFRLRGNPVFSDMKMTGSVGLVPLQCP